MRVTMLLSPRFHREHRNAQRSLSEYLDGNLGDSERRRVEEHVGMCPKCRQLLASLRRTLEELRGLGGASRPGLADGIVQRLSDP
ncbi:MAG: zf-HC2 domain-containing protein [Thermoleophilaceae bacterium]|nr:zf-HC2 domain-containing protein [Thermoleophilaceae bacterium]